MKAVILKHREWDRIFKQIKEDHKATPATYLVRSRMRDTLGFTVREHVVYRDGTDVKYSDFEDWRDYRTEIHLDFYSEPARTMFLLRYMGRD